MTTYFCILFAIVPAITAGAIGGVLFFLALRWRDPLVYVFVDRWQLELPSVRDRAYVILATVFAIDLGLITALVLALLDARVH